MSKKMTKDDLVAENARLAAEIVNLKTELAASVNRQNPLPFLRSQLARQKQFNFSRRDLQLLVQDGYDFYDADEEVLMRAFDAWMKETVQIFLDVEGVNDEGKPFAVKKIFDEGQVPTIMDVLNISYENENYSKPDSVNVIMMSVRRDGSFEIVRNPNL